MSSVEFQNDDLATPPDLTKVAVVMAGDVAHQAIVQEFLDAGVPQAVDAANPLPVSVGTVTVTGGLTDAELRASPVPVAGTVSVTGVATAANQATEIAALASILSAVDGIEGLLAPPLSVTGALTDTQLRASAVPVSGTVAVTGVATAAKQDTQTALLAGGLPAALVGGRLDVNIGAGTVTVTGGLTDAELRASPVPVSGTVSVTGVATAAKQDSQTALLAGGLPAALGAGGGLKIDGSGTALPVSGTITVTGVATAAKQDSQITLLAGGLPAALATGGGLKTDMTTIVGTAPSTSSGNKDAGTLRVTLATDQVALTNALLTTPGGNVASAATDSGNPLKVGAVYRSTKPTFTDGQRGDLQIGTRGSLLTQIATADGTNSAVVTTPSDGFGNQQGLFTVSQNVVFNGSQWERIRSDGVTGGQAVGGTVASAATDSGNPVKVGGKYNATPPTVSDGQRIDWQSDTRGSQRVTIMAGNSTTNANVATAADGTGGFNGLYTITQAELWNGASWDRVRSNEAITVLASAARTATTNSGDAVNYNGRGVHVIVNVTASGGAFSIVPKITGKDPISSTYYDILVGTAITSTGITILKVYPGIGVIAGGAASDIIPRTWRVTVTPGDATSVTYSVAAVTVL